MSKPLVDIFREVYEVPVDDQIRIMMDEADREALKAKVTELIPVELIDTRKVNEYIISDIEELASSIEEHGLQQNIIVKRNGERYTLIAGERRLTAIKLILKRGTRPELKMVMAEIYPADISERLEKAIYEETNDTQRNDTLFERVYRMNPREKFFYKKDQNVMDEQKMADYIQLKINSSAPGYTFLSTPLNIAKEEAKKASLMEDESYSYTSYITNSQGKAIKIKWDIVSTMVDYITLKLNARYKDVKITSSAVRKNVDAIMECKYKPIIDDLIFKGKLPVRDLRVISKLSEEEQIEAYNKIIEGKDWKTNSISEEKTDIKILSDNDKLKEIKDGLKTINKKYTEYSINSQALEGDDKKIYKKVQKIIEMITEITEK